LVELIRAHSNKESLRTRLADLQRRIDQAEPRQPEPTKPVRRPYKRTRDQAEIDEMCRKYRSGISTNQLMAEHHLAKRTTSALLRANGVQLRRQGLNNEQAREAADLYQAGRSLAWIGAHFGGLSPTTIARILRGQGIHLRPRRSP
jgi:hypothetical protein